MDAKQEAIDIFNDIMLKISEIIEEEESEEVLNKLYELQDSAADRILDFINKI